MERHDAQRFLDNEIKGRYPGAEWTLPVEGDWVRELGYLDEAAALSAIRVLRGKNNYKTPVLETFARLARESTPNRSPVRTDYFIQYQGGGRTTLNPGYFFQVVTTDSRHSQVAQDTKTRMEQQHGGEWRVITDTTYSAMIKARRQLYLAGESK